MPATGAVRASFGIGTTGEEVDRLVAAVHALARGGPRWHYERMAGRWTPVPGARTPPDWAQPNSGAGSGGSHGLSPCTVPADRHTPYSE